jgi:hypothetical protein
MRESFFLFQIESNIATKATLSHTSSIAKAIQRHPEPILDEPKLQFPVPPDKTGDPSCYYFPCLFSFVPTCVFRIYLSLGTGNGRN